MSGPYRFFKKAGICLRGFTFAVLVGELEHDVAICDTPVVLNREAMFRAGILVF